MVQTDISIIAQKFQSLRAHFNEQSLRVWCAAEARAIGHGGITKVHVATKISKITIAKGLKELELFEGNSNHSLLSD